MLDKNGIRMLSYIVAIDDIEAIEGSDNCEAAVVGGWKIMIRKNTFTKGEYAIYFEIDSKVPETSEFEFLAKKHYKIKTQKYTFGGKGNFISQGSLMPLSDFPQYFNLDRDGWDYTDEARKKVKCDGFVELHDDMTTLLGVTYSVADDNKRKSNSDKYSKMKARHQKLFANNKLVKWLYKRKWGKSVLFFFLGNKRDSKSGWPVGRFPGVSKTDSERIENLPFLLGNGETYVATEKLDGTSTTFVLERKHFNRFEFYVCSRNVRMFTEDQKCFHDENIYWEMAKKYDIENQLKNYLMQNKNLKYVALQGESVGNVQGNPLKLTENEFYCFSFITSDKLILDPYQGKELAAAMGIKWVPILGEITLPDTMDEMKELATGYSQINSEVLREGIVYRSIKNPNEINFKNVSNEFLLSK